MSQGVRRLALAAVASLAACDPLGPIPARGSETGTYAQDALVVSPGEIDFGTVSVLRQGYATSRFTVTNAGAAPVTVHGQDEVVSDDPASRDAFAVAADPIFQLGPGESQDFLVTFRPSTDATYAGELRINYGIETIELYGVGSAPVASLALTDLSATPVGCTTNGTLTVSNAGSEPLELGAPKVSGADAEDFTVGEPDRTRLRSGEELDLSVDFAPSADGHGLRDATITLPTNDPLRPEASIAVEALGYEGEQVTERFTYAPGVDADWLFVVDTSGVMSAYLVRARDAMESLVGALDDGKVNLHAAVVSDGATCPTTTPAWVTSDDPRSERVDTLEDGFRGNGGQGSTTLLDEAASALDEASGGCLDGFLRQDAQLHVVVVAGSGDASPLTVEAQLAALEHAAPDASDVVVSAIIATTSNECAGVDYGAGYADAAVLTGGVIGDLCDENWTDTFAMLANVSILAGQGGLTHELEQLPVVDTLEVKVDGVPWSDWTYDEAANAIVFSDPGAPDAGSTVQISYMAATPCE